MAAWPSSSSATRSSLAPAGHGSGHGRRLGGQPLERGPVDAAAAGGPRPPPPAAGAASGRRPGRRRRRGGPRRPRSTTPGATSARAGTPAPTGRAATTRTRYHTSSLVQAIVRGRGADRGHEHVGVGVAERGGHRVLVLQREHVARAGRSRRCSSTRAAEQHVVGARERVRRRPRAAPVVGRLGPAQGVDVAQAAPALLEVGLEQERHLAGCGVALVDPVARARSSHDSRRACATAARAPSARLVGERRVAGQVADGEQRRWRCRGRSAASGSASLTGAHRVAELQPWRPRSGTRCARRPGRRRAWPSWRRSTSRSLPGASSARP